MAARRRIALVGPLPAPWDELTLDENLRFVVRLPVQTLRLWTTRSCLVNGPCGEHGGGLLCPPTRS